MAVDTTRFLALAMVVLVGVIISGHHHGVSAQSCDRSNIQGLVSECGNYVMKGGVKEPPSPACCAVLKKADLPCVCKYVTPFIEQFIDVEKVIYVAKTCGLSIPYGTKCGSVTIPGHGSPPPM